MDEECPFRTHPVVKYAKRNFPVLTACPTCGRCEVRPEFYEIVAEVDEAISGLNSPVHVAVMGCAVNGPGEAKDADIGVACGRGNAVLFERGEKIKAIPMAKIVPELMARIPYIIPHNRQERRVEVVCWSDMSARCDNPNRDKPCFAPALRDRYVEACHWRAHAN